MDETFLNLLDRYCRRVFSIDNLKPKIIQGREVTAAELGAFIKAYAAMFACDKASARQFIKDGT